MVARQRAEITAQWSAKLQRANESKKAALERLAEDAKAHTERAVAEERKRAAEDKALAVSRIEGHAEAIVKALDVKLRAAIEARERADKIADSSMHRLEDAQREGVEQRIKASLFHKASMILRLRLAVASTRYTAQHCSTLVEVKRALGKRIVLLEQRYESDVVALKRRADVAIKRAVIVERAMLNVARTLGLGGASAEEPSAASSPDVDGLGIGREAGAAQSELRETQDRIYAIKAELLDLREALRSARQRRSEIVGTAKFLDGEINLMGRQVSSEGGSRATEREASRLQRLHQRLEAEAASAEKVRRTVVEMEQREASLKDERRALKTRARSLESAVLEKVVKQHMEARAALVDAQLRPESLLPARIGRLPEPEPLELPILLPRHCLDVDQFQFDLGRRDFLRARAMGRASAAMRARQAGERTDGGEAVSAFRLNEDDSDDEDFGCPPLRVLPVALHGEEASATRADEQRFIRDILRDPAYDEAVGPGYVARAEVGRCESPSEIVAALEDLTSEA